MSDGIHAGDDPSTLFTKADVIPLANLHRLDLKPGDQLAVIAPDWVTAADQFARFCEDVAYVLDMLGVRAAIFPHGTKLDVIASSTD